MILKELKQILWYNLLRMFIDLCGCEIGFNNEFVLQISTAGVICNYQVKFEFLWELREIWGSKMRKSYFFKLA